MIDRKQLAAMIKDHMLSGRAPSQAMAWTREDWEAIIDALTPVPEATTRESVLEEAATLCDSHVMHSEKMKERAVAAMDDDSAAQWGAMRLAQERLADAIRDLKRSDMNISPMKGEQK